MSVVLNNGVHMPLLGLGTFRLWSPDVQNVIEAALSQGYRLIDTAFVYRNESSIGDILKTTKYGSIKREDIFITSKLGNSFHGSGARSGALSSLNALRLSYLDLYLIHWPGAEGIKSSNPENTRLRKESWLELEKLFQEGKFKCIGVSNFTLTHMEELLEYCSVVPAVLQIEVHPYLVQTPLREFCQKHGIHVQAYSSLGSHLGCKELLSDPTVCKVAANHNKTSAQVLLRWAIEHQMSVIPKTCCLERLKENMEIFDFSLTPEEVQSLDNLDKEKHYCWDPKEVV